MLPLCSFYLGPGKINSFFISNRTNTNEVKITLCILAFRSSWDLLKIHFVGCVAEMYKFQDSARIHNERQTRGGGRGLLTMETSQPWWFQQDLSLKHIFCAPQCTAGGRRFSLCKATIMINQISQMLWYLVCLRKLCGTFHDFKKSLIC